MAEQRRAVVVARDADLNRQAELTRRRAAEEETKKQTELAAKEERERARLAAEREAYRKTHGFASIVGQGSAIQRLVEFANLYYQGGNPPGHVLLTGKDGVGKRTLGRAFAAECGGKCVETDARALLRTGDLVSILTSLDDGDALMISDVGNASKVIIDFLAGALRDSSVTFVVDKGMFAKTINVPLKRFTCLATAPTKAECPSDLSEAFPLILPLQSYSQPDLASICERLARRRGIGIAPSAAALVAAASAGTPHHIEVLINRLAGLGKTTISEEDISAVSSVLGFSIGSVGSSLTGDIDTFSGIDFEKAIATLLQGMGFHTEITKASGDGGIDIVAHLDRPLIGGRYLIQCKRFAPGNLVGAATVRDFYGALTADRNAIKGILITTSGFTSQALAFAQQLPIELIGGPQLRQLLGQHPTVTKTQSAPASLFDGEQ